MVHQYARAASHHRGAGLLSSLASAAGTVLNKTIDLLPTELHLPGYQFCGPATNLKKRLARGDRGINPLDSYCKEHDIAYSRNSDNKSRSVADRILADKAWQRVKAADASIGEKAAAWAVTNIMKAKSKLGGGGRVSKKKTRKSTIKKRRKRQSKKGKGLYLRPYKQGSGYKKKKKRSTRHQ